ncbi:MAG: PQQ-dependent sugar dehydrogenase [Candidatus Levybacteria bacterium]|nr:PQQ-dependent sugar dehydrogenase [Candidatus Levybacteria bacterium]
MKYFLLLCLTILFISGGAYFLFSKKDTVIVPAATRSMQASKTNDAQQIEIVAQNLDTPWAVAVLPDNSMLVTERKGTVQFIDAKGNLATASVGTLSSVKEIGEGGLLGIALHPKFTTNNYVYLYYTYGQNGNNTRNRVVRMTYKDGTLGNEKIVVDNIPGASNHNGGRIKFGPDNYLYITTGDAQEPSAAQDKNSLAGKILRVTDTGKPVPGNPFNNAVYSYGHRNVQGLAWDDQKQLWATEHGRSGVQSGLDELNLIKPGLNYGWPEIEGDERRSGMQTAKRNSGGNTWAPAGAAFIGNSLFFAGLRGQTLYEAVIENGNVTEIKEHLTFERGRIREVIAAPQGGGMLYITTSNLDGRGSPAAGDDKILKVNPQKL